MHVAEERLATHEQTTLSRRAYDILCQHNHCPAANLAAVPDPSMRVFSEFGALAGDSANMLPSFKKSLRLGVMTRPSMTAKVVMQLWLLQQDPRLHPCKSAKCLAH